MVKSGLEHFSVDHDKMTIFIDLDLIKVKGDAMNQKLRFGSFDFPKALEIEYAKW